VLQCVAVCCKCVAVCVAVCCSVLQCVAVCCSVLQCGAVCCSVLQCVSPYNAHPHTSLAQRESAKQRYRKRMTDRYRQRERQIERDEGDGQIEAGRQGGSIVRASEGRQRRGEGGRNTQQLEEKK